MFRFESPEYLYLLLLLPVFGALFAYSNYRRKKKIAAFGDSELVAQLMPNHSSFRVSLKYALLLLAFMSGVFLLARPQFGGKYETVKRRGVEVMIALDISNSMMAQDVAPNRLERAKLLVSRLIDKLNTDKVGLIVFAGEAFIQLPMTSDYVSAKMFLGDITPALIGRQGTNIADAVKLSMRSFTGSQSAAKTIVIITDGENHEPGALEAVQEASAQGIQVNVLGIGSPDGTPIPVSGTDDYMKDRNGNVVVTKLNEDLCKQLAQAGGGIYSYISNNNSAQKAIDGQIEKLSKDDVESKVYTEYNEQFVPIAWAVLLILAVEMFVMNKRNKRIGKIKLF